MGNVGIAAWSWVLDLLFELWFFFLHGRGSVL